MKKYNEWTEEEYSGLLNMFLDSVVIDGEKLNDSKYSLVCNLFGVIDKAIEIASRDEWISVDDRLPEKEGEVLTYGYDNVIRLLLFSKYVDLSTTPEGFAFYTYNLNNIKNITHWRQLPNLPKELNDE